MYSLTIFSPRALPEKSKIQVIATEFSRNYFLIYLPSAYRLNPVYAPKVICDTSATDSITVIIYNLAVGGKPYSSACTPCAVNEHSLVYTFLQILPSHGGNSRLYTAYRALKTVLLFRRRFPYHFNRIPFL